MACTPGASLSPGYIRLNYLHSTQSIPHSTRVRVVALFDLLDVGLVVATAEAWATKWEDIVPGDFTCASYSALRADGSLIYTGGLPTIHVGSHAVASGALDYASRTLCFTGRGVPGTISECSGEAIHRVFVGSGYEFIPRQKFMAAGADGNVDDYVQFLEDSPYLWADHYGNKAGIRAIFPVQFNAYHQRRNGT